MLLSLFSTSKGRGKNANYDLNLLCGLAYKYTFQFMYKVLGFYNF